MKQVKVGAWSAKAIASDSAGLLAELRIAMPSCEMTIADGPLSLAGLYPVLKYCESFAETGDVAVQ